MTTHSSPMIQVLQRVREEPALAHQPLCFSPILRSACESAEHVRVGGHLGLSFDLRGRPELLGQSVGQSEEDGELFAEGLLGG